MSNIVRRSNGVSVIIPAAGSGERFRKSVPIPTEDKLYARIEGKPLILRILSVFDSIPSVREIVVALEPGTHARFRNEILSQAKFKKPIRIVQGGKTRAESVWNALKQVSEKSVYVCIHDGARPLVRPEWVDKLAKNLNGYDAVVLGRQVVPTVKTFEHETMLIKETLDRKELFEAETPQLIKKEKLFKSYKTLGKRAFQTTDDVSLIEATGGRVKAVIHSKPNIKVTTYQDLVLARNLLEGTRSRASLLRFGLGFDRHRLVSKRPFWLGGLRIPSPVGPLGHSDGDPLLHAITDGILGSIGAGDIGDFFPNTKRWENVPSVHFLKEAIKLAEKKGFEPSQIDATIILERPKLGAYKKKIQKHIAKLLALSESDVSIKAKTAEGLGPEGLGEAISAQALVVLSPI